MFMDGGGIFNVEKLSLKEYPAIFTSSSAFVQPCLTATQNKENYLFRKMVFTDETCTGTVAIHNVILQSDC